MKRLPIIFTLVVLALSATFSAPALAWRHGVRVGVFFGPGFYYPSPYYYGYPPYYPPYYYPPVAYPPVPAAPVTYVEQGAAQPAAAPAPGFWYYCDGSKAYYPYVRECPAGWQKVSPQPAN